jgi:hypothetical protein
MRETSAGTFLITEAKNARAFGTFSGFSKKPFTIANGFLNN